ncbi:MAG: DUF4175 domain-containing protein [Planctomycetes bacterium]|nr:DUF4175 domain-containing protein [Planctomycetota bacterium]
MTAPPDLSRPLASLRRRIRVLALLRGASWVLSAAALLLAAAYALDRGLDLPRGVRLSFLVGSLAALATLAYRGLARPLTASLPPTDMALIVERSFPELRERLVSAVQLASRPSPPGESGALVEELRAVAASTLRELPLRRALRPREAFLSAAGAVALLGGAVLGLARDRDETSVFLARLLGIERAWPRRTHLEILLPDRSGGLQVERDRDVIRVRLPLGTDLPVRVLAKGKVPPEVRLHVRGERPRAATRTGPEEFVHTFRSVIAPFSFHATGGDDTDEDPTVVVRPHRPPEVASTSVDLEYPPYTGLAPVHRDGGSFEAPVGTLARVTVHGTPGAKRGLLRFFRTGKELTLEALAQEASFAASFGVEESDRYLALLEDDEGLRTAQPAVFTVTALPDRRPELRVFAPDRAELDVTPNGAIPVRAAAKDDFGVQALDLRIGVGETPPETVSLLAPGPDSKPRAPAREVAGARRIEISAIAVREGEGTRAPREGDSVLFLVEALDNRPEPNRAESPRFRALVQSPVEILRKLNDGIARVREEVEALGRLQREKIDRLNDLLAALEGDARAATERHSFVSAAVGQARVGSQARRIEGDFLRAFETGAFNRLDRNADAAILALEALDAELADRAGDRARGSEEGSLLGARAEGLLRRRDSGELGSLEFLGKFLDMLDLARQIAERLSPEATAALEDASTAVEASRTRDRLAAARAAQDEVLATIDRLLLLLGEWDNYQAVVGLAREILERQKALNQQTKEWTRNR